VSLKQVFNAPKYLLLGFIAAMLVAVWLLQSIRKRQIVLPRNATFGFFTLLVVWEFLTIYRSTGLALSLREYSIQLALYLVSLVAVICIRDRERIENLLHFAVAAGVIAASYGLMQYYGYDHLIFRRVTILTDGYINLDFLILPQKPENIVKIYSTMGHRNYLSGYLICLLPILISRLISSLSIFLGKGTYWFLALRQALVYGFSSMIMFSVVILTHTRGSWVGLSAGVICFLFFLYFKFRGLGVSRPVVITALGAISLICLLGSGNALGASIVTVFAVLFMAAIVYFPRMKLVPAFMVFMVITFMTFQITGTIAPPVNPMVKMREGALKRLSNSFDLKRGSAFQRVLIWRTALWIITDNPVNFLFGTGFGTFGLNYMPYQAKVLADPRYEEFIPEINKSIYAHSEYLHFFSEIGLVGILLMMATAGTFVWSVSLYVLKMRPTHQNLLLIGMLSSTIAVLSHNIFSFSLHLPYTSSLFYCLVAFCLRFTGMREYRYTWGGASQTETDISIGDGLLCVGFLKLKDDSFRAWTNWLVEPSSLTDLSTLTIEVNKDSKKNCAVISDFSNHMEKSPMIHGKSLKDGDILVASYKGEVLCQMENSGKRNAKDILLIVEGSIVLIIVILTSLVVLSVRDSIYMDMYWRNGFLKFRAKHFDEAVIDYKRALELQPTRGEVLFDFGRTLMDSNRNFSAIEQFQKARANFVDPANDHNIALCYFKEKKLKEAEEHYRQALKLNPIYEQSLANLAYYLVTNGRVDEAKEYLDIGMKYYPKNGQFLTSAGVLEARNGNFDKAAQFLAASVKLNPDNWSARINLATILFNLKKYDEALSHFEALHKERPDDDVVTKKYYGGMVASVRPKLAESPNDEELLLTLVRAYAKLGEMGESVYSQEAVRILRRYLEVVPQSGEGRYYLAWVLQQLGYSNEALTEAEASVSLLSPTSDIYQEAENLFRILSSKVSSSKLSLEKEGQ
jgi:tetratricopeptide (TPR) repeat protein